MCHYFMFCRDLIFVIYSVAVIEYYITMVHMLYNII